MGISSSAIQGQSDTHIRRLTTPCRLETALARPVSLRASTVMQNDSPWLFGSTRPSPISPSCDRPIWSASGPRCSYIRSEGKRSCPAGTGVWVVKALIAATSFRAASNGIASSCIRWRIASRLANAECPSFMWMTPG